MSSQNNPETSSLYGGGASLYFPFAKSRLNLSICEPVVCGRFPETPWARGEARQPPRRAYYVAIIDVGLKLVGTGSEVNELQE